MNIGKYKVLTKHTVIRNAGKVSIIKFIALNKQIENLKTNV